MQLHEAHELMESLSSSDATKAIKEGWTLLAIFGTARVMYVLGKGEPSPVKETVSPASVISVSKPQPR